jgi:hypothetical protein
MICKRAISMEMGPFLGNAHESERRFPAVICHILIDLLVLANTTADRIGLAVLGLAMAGLLAWLAIRIRRRVSPVDLLAKEA